MIFYVSWGIVVAKNPWTFIIASIVFTLTMSIGLLNFTAENRPTKLWMYVLFDHCILATKVKVNWYLDNKFAIGYIAVKIGVMVNLVSFTLFTYEYIRPQDSGFVENTEWLQDNFPNDLRFQSYVLVGDDVLSPETLLWV